MRPKSRNRLCLHGIQFLFVELGLMSEKMRKVTETNATVLIQGESGTGKGIVSGHSFTTSTTS